MSEEKKKGLFARLAGTGDGGCCCSPVEIIPEGEVKKQEEERNQKADSKAEERPEKLLGESKLKLEGWRQVRLPSILWGSTWTVS